MMIFDSHEGDMGYSGTIIVKRLRTPAIVQEFVQKWEPFSLIPDVIGLPVIVSKRLPFYSKAPVSVALNGGV